MAAAEREKWLSSEATCGIFESCGPVDLGLFDPL